MTAVRKSSVGDCQCLMSSGIAARGVHARVSNNQMLHAHFGCVTLQTRGVATTRPQLALAGIQHN